MTRDERAIEELVERELARASEVEPVAGLEDRLIASLRAAELVAQRHVRPSWWWAGGTVLAAAAAIVLAVFAGRQPSSTPPPAATQSASAVTPSGSGADRVKPEPPWASLPESGKAPSRPRETARASRPRPPAPGARTPNHASPRLVVFPSPAPLSSQERLLLALASRPEAAIAFAEAQQRPMTPLEIKEIVIEPLGPSGNE